MPRSKRTYVVAACIVATIIAGASWVAYAQCGSSDSHGCQMGQGQTCPMMGGTDGAPRTLTADPRLTRTVQATVAKVAVDGSSAVVQTADGPRLVLLCATSGANGGKPVALKAGDKIQMVTALVALSVQPAKSGATNAVIYTCPMHPEVTSTKPGSCPKCGMDLVKRG